MPTLCLLLAALAQAPTSVVLALPRVVGSPREIAAAQVPLGRFGALAREAMPTGAEFTAPALALAARIGKAKVTMVLDTSAGDGPRDRLHVDADGNGKVDAGEQLSVSWEDGFAEVDLGVFALPVRVMLFAKPDGAIATARTCYHFGAPAHFGDTACAVTVIDMDLDGVVSRGDRWLCLAKEHMAKTSLANAMFMAREFDEPWLLGNRAVTIADVLDGDRLKLTFGAPAQSRNVVLATRNARSFAWFAAQFDLERAQFLAEHGIAADRPVTKDALVWYHTDDLDDARAHARELGRPLLVEFVTGGCPWCKRLQWLNYRDAEVVARLRDFALVRLDNDLDLARSAERLGLRGVPQVGVFDAAGDLVHKLRGWSPPDQHARALDAARVAVGLAAVAR